MQKLTATTPHGTFTRTTERVYSHVVVLARASAPAVAVKACWSGSQGAAHKLGRKEAGYGYVVLGVYPVDAAPVPARV